MKRWLLMIGAVLGGLTGCVGVPDGVTVVEEFEAERYLGKWYEIARLENSFEKGMTNVTAEYSMRPDGRIKILNAGYKPEEGKWKEAEGKAAFVEDNTIPRLKVSFFGPFYGAYNVIALDSADYNYSMVCSGDLSYLWILAREPELDPETMAMLVAKAKELGFDTDALLMVDHSPAEGR